MALKTAGLNPRFTLNCHWIFFAKPFFGKMTEVGFCEEWLILFFLTKAQITQKKINLPNSFFLNYVRLSAIFYLVKKKKQQQ